MSKIEKILKYIDSITEYSAKLENGKLNIQYQYTGSAEDMRMYLMLSHNSIQYTGDVSIYDFNRDCYIFEYRFTCSEEEDVIKVLDILRHFSETIGESIRQVRCDVDRASGLGHSQVDLKRSNQYLLTK